jgi:hypothetical protein
MWFLENAWIILALPVASFVIILLFGKRFPRKGAGAPRIRGRLHSKRGGREDVAGQHVAVFGQGP